jgi:hypothetical protein
MRPLRLTFMAGRQALIARKVPSRLVPSTSSQASGVSSCSFAAGKTPALAHRTSIPPNCAVASAAIRCASGQLETSAASAEDLPPAALISFAVASAGPMLRATTRTRAPLVANTFAMPLPMPLLAPVTMTECPSIEFSMRPSLPCERGFSPAMERAVMREIWALRDQPCRVYMQNGRKLAAALANAWSVAPWVANHHCAACAVYREAQTLLDRDSGHCRKPDQARHLSTGSRFPCTCRNLV